MTSLSAAAPSGTEPASWFDTTAIAMPASRSARVSPTQTIATSPARHAAKAFTNRPEQRRGRADEQVAGMRLFRPLGDGACQRDAIGTPPVHLPVAGDKFFS